MSVTILREELGFPPPPGFTPELQELFNPLRTEVTFLHGLWDTHEQLFGSDDSIAALNSTASGAFAFLGYVLRHELIMTICRITDPKATGKKQNLTLDRIVSVIKNQSDKPDIIDRLEAQLAEIDSVCTPFRERRNRLLGHLDLLTLLNTHPVKLPGIEREQFVDILRRIGMFMNEILGHYAATYADFVPVVTGPPSNIVHALKEFQRLRKLDFEQQISVLRDQSGG